MDETEFSEMDREQIKQQREPRKITGKRRGQLGKSQGFVLEIIGKQRCSENHSESSHIHRKTVRTMPGT